MIFCVLLTLTQAIKIDVAPYGVVTVNEGTGRIQAGSYELIVMVQRPSSLQRRFLTPLLQQAEALLSTISAEQIVNMDAYVTRFRRLQAPTRVKRGLINAVGEITKSLFGIATEKDVNKIKNTVNELVAESNRRKVVIRDLIVCANQTIKQQRHVISKVNVLASHVNQLQEDVQTLGNVYDQVGQRVHNAEMLSIIENVLSLAEELSNQEEMFANQFQYKRDLAVIGHLTETLIPRSVFKDVRKHVKIDVSDDYLYSNLEVRVIRFDEDRLGYWTSLPILDREPFTHWRILTVPFPVTNSAHRQIIPEVTAVGHGLETGNFIEADLCRFKDPMLCPSPVEYGKLKCINSILNQDDQQLENCRTMIPDNFDVNVKRVTPTSVVIATNGERVEERCDHQAPQSYVLEANSYLLTIDAGCVLEGNNWKFQATTVEKRQVELEESIILLPAHFNVSISMPSRIPMMTFNYTKIDAMVSQEYARLPDLHQLRNITLLMIPGGVAGYIALLLIIVIVIAVFVYRYYKRRSDKRRIEVKYEPTVSDIKLEGKAEEEGRTPLPVFKQFCTPM